MARVRCMHCGTEVDVDVDGQACGACGMEIPHVFGNTDLRAMGDGPLVDAPAPPASRDLGADVHDEGPDFAAPAFRPLAGPLPSQMPAPVHSSSAPPLELSRRPNEGGSSRSRAGAIRRAAHTPVVESSPLSRGVILVLLLVAAYLAYATLAG
jgi:hypothetical protein